MSKKFVLATAAGLCAFGAVTASASTLGGVETTDLGASAGVVASCDSDGVGVDYTTAYAAGGYRVTAVELSGVAAACAQQDLKITLLGSGDRALVERTGTAAGGTQTISLPEPVDAASVEGVAVVISG